MGINDWGLPAEDLADPELSAWAASVAAVLNHSDVTVDARIAAAMTTFEARLRKVEDDGATEER